MKVTALIELGYSLEEVSDAVDLNPLQVAEHTLFDDKECDDYRNEAIDKVLELNVPFTTTQNTIWTFVDRYVIAICPKCGAAMRSTTGSGSGGHYSANFFCPGDHCESVVVLTFESEAIEYRPSYSDRR